VRSTKNEHIGTKRQHHRATIEINMPEGIPHLPIGAARHLL
jgi:hypothetical protein